MTHKGKYGRWVDVATRANMEGWLTDMAASIIVVVVRQTDREWLRFWRITAVG